MAPTTVAKVTKEGALAPRVLLDEELWFGSSNASEAQAEAAAAKSMAATAGTVLGAKPFPESARRLAELSSQENAQVNAMVQVLEQDPALSAKLLRVVNSAGFGLRQRCTSVRHAVTLVGSKHLHQMATTAAVLDLFDSDSGPAVSILEHSTIVGAYCRYLGAHQGLPAEELFTAGVLHDIGKLMMLDAFGDRYHAVFDRCLSNPDALFAMERAEFGFDHGVLAAHVLKAWNIPDPIPKVVAWHHEPTRAYGSSTLHAALVQTLRLADVLVHAMQSGATRAELGTIAQHEAASYLDISAAQLDAMWDELASLRERTLHQKRGGDAVSEPSEDKSATRVRSPNQRQESADVPQQFPCAQCGSPSFGTACPTCKGYVCPDHPIGESGWCVVCDAEYAAFAAKAPFPVTALGGAIATLVVTVPTTTLGWFLGSSDGLVRGALAGLLMAAVGMGVALVARRTIVRTHFARTRPNRSTAPHKSDS
jgi:HD-like signal output (HDOD) protein